jgi:transposase InsO family protein
VRKKIYNGEYLVREISAPKGGNNGKAYQIHFTSLPPEARQKYLEKLGTGKDDGAETSQNAPEEKEAAFLTLAGYINKYGNDEVDQALQIEAAIKDIESTRDRLEVGRRVQKWVRLFDVTDKTIRNWRRDYAAHGLTGLFRKERSEKGIKKSSCEAAADRLKLIYLDDNRTTLKEAYKQLKKEILDTGPETCSKCYYSSQCADTDKNGWKVGSYKTAQRIIKELEFGEEKCYREGLQKCRADAMPKGRVDFTKYKVNERWIGDHHNCDFFCADEYGRLARPQLTVWEDARSRVITGLTLSFQGNSHTIGLAFAHGILPKPDSPIKGVPREVLIDNGKDYRSHYLGQTEKITGRHEWTSEMRGVFSILGITAHYTKPYSGWAKPVESFFRTFKMQFSYKMPGYTGGSPDKRPEGLEEELKKLKAEGKIPTLKVAFDRIIDWIMNEYHHQIHGELGDTPMNVYLNAPRYEGGTVSKKVAEVLLYHTEERTAGRDGIRFKNALYKDRALYSLQDKKVIVRYDPLDLSSIIVEHEGKCVCTAERYTAMQTQEDVEANAKEQAYYMGRIKEKYEGYKRGSTPVRRKKSKEVVVGETLDKPDEKDVVRITGLEQAAKMRKKNTSSKKPTPPPETEESTGFEWYDQGYEEFKKAAAGNGQ